MHASDNGAVGTLGKRSVTFAAFRDRVLAAWLRRVLDEVPAARQLDEPTVMNNFPILYDGIAEALTPEYPREYATEGTNLACNLGRDRAKLTEYTPGDVVHELQIFRQVALEVAHSEGLYLTHHEKGVIAKSIDTAIREAVTTYSSTNLEIGQLFIASLSHDLRNPLNIVGTCAQLISRKTDDPQITRLADKMHMQLKEVDAMLQTLLDAAMLNGRQRINLHISQFDIRSLVEEACTDAPPDENRCVITGDQITGFWCRSSLKRALQNLLSNARKYGRPDTDITVNTCRVDHRVYLSVHNEGPAILPDDIERMFSAFQRLASVDIKGWGLGLPFVRNVAESHHGTVVVDSETGRGTTFTISLPLDCRDCETARPPSCSFDVRAE